MKHIRFVSLLLACITALSLCGCAKKAPEVSPWQEQYDLGVRYLSEGNYEEAILTFLAAIEIDPKQSNAYVALAEVYEQQKDYVNAMLILDQAREMAADVDGSRLYEVLERIRQTSGFWSVHKSVHGDGTYYIRANNEQGQIVFHRNYEADGTLISSDEYQYNAQGELIAIMAYDANGRLLRESTMDPSRPDWSRTREYDYDETGALTGSTVYEYGHIGFQDGTPVIGPIRREEYDAAGVMYYALDEEYNDSAETIGFRRYNGDGVLEMYSITEYDVPGMKSRRTIYNADGSLDVVEEYYEKGWVQIFYDNGVERHRIVYD